jgi:hypothetical protein
MDCHSHDHDHGEDDPGFSLLPQMDLPRVFCLNEVVLHSGRAVLKTHEERLSAVPSLLSPDDDQELLLHIPFTESVTIQSISVRSESNRFTAPPKIIKLFTNREDLDFETARELPCQMLLELVPPDHLPEGSIDYPVRPAGRFQNISSLSVFFSESYDERLPTEITFVGVKGKGTRMRRQAVNTVYESRAMLKDHKVPGFGDAMSNQLS